MHVSEGELKEFIIDSGLVAKKDIDAASKEAKAKGQSLGAVLVSRGSLSEDALRRIQAYVLGIPFVNLKDHRISADILHTSFREHSGLEVREISGGFVLDSVHAQLKDFTVETAGSRIYQNTLLSYSSLSALTNLAGTVNVKATTTDGLGAIGRGAGIAATAVVLLESREQER